MFIIKTGTKKLSSFVLEKSWSVFMRESWSNTTQLFYYFNGLAVVSDL